MKTKLDILSRLQELVEEVEAEESANAFGIGDLVDLPEGLVGLIEDIDDINVTVRVQAVHGDEYEPTDDVRVLAVEQVSLHGQPKEDADDEGAMPDEDSDEEVPDDEPDEEEDEDEKAKKSLYDWVTFTSEDGVTTGQITDMTDEGYTLEVYAHTEDGFEATGVEVTHRDKDLKRVKEPNVKQTPRKILAKFDDISMEYDEETKIGVIDGYASTFGNVDLGGDRVMKGAYNQTFKHKQTRKVFFDHLYGVGDIAGVGEFSVDEKGLRMKADLPLEASDVKNAFVKIKFLLDKGEDMGLSIGYNTVKSRMNTDGVRDLLELAVMETSITPFPMNTEALILSAKSRKIGYHAKRHAWQTIVRKNKPDASKENQLSQDDFMLLVGEIKKLITHK